MLASVEQHVYAYPFASAVGQDEHGLHVCVATSGGDAADGLELYRGGLAAPFRAARLLWAVSGIAASRFYMTPSMRERMQAVTDPIVVSDTERLRFEALSACCGVYARADLLPAALTAAPARAGSTNVDFNSPMRAALARVRDEHSVELSVGEDGLSIARGQDRVVERRMAIPRRWIRALGEVQALQADMSPAMSVSGREAWRFLRSLPRRRGGRAAYRVVESGNDGLRLAHGSTSGVPLAGTERLRALEPLAAEASRLVVYVHSSGATGWSLEFADSRLLLVVSPTPSRGLSGEGALLSNLVDGSAAADATLLAALCWRPQVPLDELADELGLDKGVVRGRLARLAASGLVGFDLTDGAYFFRSLPIGQHASVDQPRLARARELVGLGRVLLSSANGRHTATVTGREGDYLVAIDRQMSCTCAWFASNAAGRGPCSHILAVQLTLSR